MTEREAATSRRDGNNFGLLRLLFAGLVILSHAFEIVDGDRSREPLSRVFATLSLGEVAVDGFFLVSGYLITQSVAAGGGLAGYVGRRLLRIGPGYLVCFWLCVLVVAPLAGGAGPLSPAFDLVADVTASLTLMPPEAPGAFAGLPYPILNGPLWTIAYEARCYLLAPLLALAGRLLGLRRHGRWVILAAVALGLVLNALQVLYDPTGGTSVLFGRPGPAVRLASLFGTGALFFLFRADIRLTARGAALAGATLVAALFDHVLAEAALAVLGGYVLFWFAFAVRWPGSKAARPGLKRGRPDLSYGLYLYAWPLQNLLLEADRTLQPWPLFGLTLAGAGTLAWLSWTLVEAPCLAWITRPAGAGQPPRPRPLRRGRSGCPGRLPTEPACPAWEGSPGPWST